ncbi:MAG: ArsA family ATPase [Pseudomonadota bacterium]
MSVDALLERKVLFVGGKGGVGKTTVATCLALLAAARGRRTLLASTDPAHSLGDVIEVEIGNGELALAPNLFGMEIDPEREADRHIEAVKRDMRDLVRPALYHEVDRQLDLARDGPGAAESALLERVAQLMEDAFDRYDLVVFDTAPTGHTLRLLTMPEVMTAWAEGLLRNRERSGRLGRMLAGLGGARVRGDDLSRFDQERRLDATPESRIEERLLARRQRFAGMRGLLLDPARTGFVLVLTPQRLPIQESAKARDRLRRFDIELAGIVVNQVLPDDADGAFLAARRRGEHGYLAEIDQLFANTPRHRLRLRPTDVVGLAALRDLAEALASGEG